MSDPDPESRFYNRSTPMLPCSICCACLQHVARF